MASCVPIRGSIKHTWKRFNRFFCSAAESIAGVHALQHLGASPHPAVLSSGPESKQLSKLFDSTCASWGARSTAAHMELMLAHMHCHTVAPSAASMQRLAWLASHRPVDRHSSVWSAALLMLGTARSILAHSEHPLTPAAVRAMLSAAQLSLQQAAHMPGGSSTEAEAAALPAAATLSLLSSCSSLSSAPGSLSPSDPLLQSPWAQQAMQETCEHVLRFALQPPSKDRGNTWQTAITRILAHSIAGNHARAGALAQDLLQQRQEPPVLAAAVASCVLLRGHFAAANTMQPSVQGDVECVHAFWRSYLHAAPRHGQHTGGGRWEGGARAACTWAVLHTALVLPQQQGTALLRQLRASGMLSTPTRGGLRQWEEALRAAVVEGGGCHL